MFRFIHTSDLHLGKRFGNFSGDLPSRLREARHQIITKLALLAHENQVDTILFAGDTFDSETPAIDVRRQAMRTMAAYPHIKWIILPGNHDSLQATHLWESLQQDATDNITLVLEPQPIKLTSKVVLLPAPCTTRRPGRDLTAWMDSCNTPEGMIRIGLAHGPVRNFCEEGSVDDIIAPDRALSAGLDYLALGDWHGRIEINPRTHYCGTPEPDRFKHEAPATALLVTIETAGALPKIKPLPTASFCWFKPEITLLEADDPCTILHDFLPHIQHRRQTLVRMTISGYSPLSKRSCLMQEIEKLRPDFAFFALDDTNLATLYELHDLDNIDKAGILRHVANELLEEAENKSLPQEQRTIAHAALMRLYFYAQESSQ